MTNSSYSVARSVKHLITKHIELASRIARGQNTWKVETLERNYHLLNTYEDVIEKSIFILEEEEELNAKMIATLKERFEEALEHRAEKIK